MEVLCNKRAFVVKRLAENHADPANAQTGQITWSYHGGPVAAWKLATSRAGFAETDESQ